MIDNTNNTTHGTFRIQEASNVAEAKKIAATPDMLPNSFINNYEDMEVVVRTEDGIPVGVMDYNAIKLIF